MILDRPIVRYADGSSLGRVRVSLLEPHEAQKLLLFGSSVLWRASVSREISSARLGPVYEEPFRQYLLGGPFPQDAAASVFVLELGGSDPVAWEQVMSTPTSIRADGFHFHHFLMAGLYFHFSVGKRLPHQFSTRLLTGPEPAFYRTDRGAIPLIDSLIGQVREARSTQRLLQQRKVRG